MNETLILDILNCINRIIPKRKNQLFFYSVPDYSDNSRALYEYIEKNGLDKGFSIVWAVKDADKYRKLLPKCVVVKHRTIKNFWYYSRSKYIFRTHSLWGNRYDEKRQIMCITWHGMPLKRLLSRDGKERHTKCNLLTSTSSFFDNELCQSLGITVEVCKHLGLPRNDFLFCCENQVKSLFGEFKKTIIWMPTFRKTAIYSDGLDTELGLPIIKKNELNSLNEFLKSKNYLLLLKLHPWSSDKLNGLSFSNIINLRDQDLPIEISLYKLLGDTDALITDYSSVYVDYMLTDKPICFAYDDFEEYQKTRGFWIESIKDYMPGEHVNNYKSLISWIDSFEKDKYKNKRHELLNTFFEYPDGKSSERVLKELGII